MNGIKDRRVVVFGGHFTVSRKQFFDALDYCFQDHRVMATDVLMTELSPGRFQKIVSDYCKSRGLHYWHPKRSGANECAIISVDKLRWKSATRLTRLRIKVGRTAPINLVEAKVVNGPWWSIWHTAAHNFGLRQDVWATVVYYSTLTPWRMRLQKRSRAKRGAGSGGDYNLGLERAQVQKELLGDLNDYHFTQELGPNRQIIGIATNMQVIEHAKELELQNGFDHAPVLSVVRPLS